MSTEESTGEVLVPELRDMVGQAEAQKREVAQLVGTLTDTQLNWRPEPQRWSIGEHIAHLCIATKPYLDTIADAVAAARARGLVAGPPYRYGWLGNWFARTMEPPPRFRMKTIRRLIPQQPRSREEVVADFTATQDAVIRSLRAANGIDLGRVTMRSPYLSMLKLSVGSAFLVILGHNRRHIWHVRRILENPALP